MQESRTMAAMTQEPCIYHAGAMQLYQTPKAYKSQGPNAEDHARAKDNARTKDQEPWTRSPAGTKSHMLRAKDLYRAKDQAPRTTSQGLACKNQGPGAKDQEPWTCRNQVYHARTKYISGPKDHEPIIVYQAHCKDQKPTSL